MVVSAERAKQACTELSDRLSKSIQEQDSEFVLDREAMRDLADILKWLGQQAEVEVACGENL